jgi:hypothetical protein
MGLFCDFEPARFATVIIARRIDVRSIGIHPNPWGAMADDIALTGKILGPLDWDRELEQHHPR